MALFIACACAIITPNGITNSNPSEVSAATKKLSKKKQHKLYASTMKKYATKVKESVSDPELYGSYDFSKYRVMYVFADIDKNGTDELIMRYRDPASGKYTGISTGYGENTSIYTIRNGKVRTVKAGADWSLVSLEPLTGRTHQLRVHCAHLGCPILGDPQYGTAESLALSTAFGLTHQQLCARELRFLHPMTGEEICITSGMDVYHPVEPIRKEE